MMDKKGAGIGLPWYTNASRLFEGATSTSVPWYTSASPQILHSFYKYPPAHFWKNDAKIVSESL